MFIEKMKESGYTCDDCLYGSKLCENKENLCEKEGELCEWFRSIDEKEEYDNDYGN